MNDKPVLKNEDVFPDNEVLKSALKESFVPYEELVGRLTQNPFDLEPGWRYYKDGNAWLCKFQFRKKTVLWLSVFDGYFKVAFYFSARLGEGIGGLDINREVRTRFEKAEFIGKVKPLVISVMPGNSVDDILKIAGYKKNNL